MILICCRWGKPVTLCCRCKDGNSMPGEGNKNKHRQTGQRHIITGNHFRVTLINIGGESIRKYIMWTIKRRRRQKSSQQVKTAKKKMFLPMLQCILVLMLHTHLSVVPLWAFHKQPRLALCDCSQRVPCWCGTPLLFHHCQREKEKERPAMSVFISP